MTKRLDKHYGGQLGETIKKLERKKIKCLCGKTYRADEFEGYPHMGGLQDKFGKHYWLYTTCPYCGYQLSWHKFPHIRNP